MVCRGVLALIVGLFFADPATAQDWKFLAESDRGALVSIDASSLRILQPIRVQRPFEARQVWVEWNLYKVKSTRARRRVTLELFNCADQTSMTRSDASYAPDGSVISSFSEEDYDFKYTPAPPATMIRAVMTYACDTPPPRDIVGEDRASAERSIQSAETRRLMQEVIDADRQLAAAEYFAHSPIIFKAAPPAQQRSAPLTSQSASGYQRQCRYLTPSGYVTVTTSGACPANYAY